MFAYIKGQIAEKSGNLIVVDCGGVGFGINTSITTTSAVGTVGDEAMLHTYLNVREDALTLYGFATKEELRLFEKLIAVSGVGPKIALNILSFVTPYKFAVSVIEDDIKELTKISGVGSKMAQKIILELKDKFKKEYGSLQKNKNSNLPQNDGLAAVPSNIYDEIIMALCTLGFTPQEASGALNAVYEENATPEVLIKNSLKQLSRK